jgi:Uma2 family endonuclease
MSATIAKFRISEYERMIDAGIFDTRRGHTIELIRGELREMFPINFDHATIVDFLARWSFDRVSKNQATVRIQQPICCPDDEAVPQPDVAWIKPVKRRPWPLPEDVLLLIEVADSSLAGDQTEKAAIYAAAGIADYWIVNIPDQCVEVRRKPTTDGYQETTIYPPGERIHPLNFPAVPLNVATLFEEIEG